MDIRLIRRLIGVKLNDPSTYWLALFVGSLINFYGQFLVPWFRDMGDPLTIFIQEFSNHPYLAIFSIILGYAFPFCVGLYSSVATLYKNR